MSTGRAEISSRIIGEMVMGSTTKRQKELDRVAYIRFASVYRDFRDIEELQGGDRGSAGAAGE